MFGSLDDRRGVEEVAVGAVVDVDVEDVLIKRSSCWEGNWNETEMDAQDLTGVKNPTDRVRDNNGARKYSEL